jgi:hypothetical protein
MNASQAVQAELESPSILDWRRDAKACRQDISTIENALRAGAAPLTATYRRARRARAGFLAASRLVFCFARYGVVPEVHNRLSKLMMLAQQTLKRLDRPKGLVFHFGDLFPHLDYFFSSLMCLQWVVFFVSQLRSQ